MSNGRPSRFRETLRQTQQAWQEASVRAEEAHPTQGDSRRRWYQAPADSWAGAVVVMLALTAVLWIVQIVNATEGQGLDRFGLKPRHVDGLWGILTQPFLHSNWGNLASDTLPFALIGWAVLIGGLREWAIASAVVLLLGGLATWLVAPAGLILGAGGLVFGWLGYLLARAIVSRRIAWIVTAVMVLVIFGTLLSNLAPSFNAHNEWAAHVCGFLAGVLIALVLHPRRKRPPKVRAL